MSSSLYPLCSVRRHECLGCLLFSLLLAHGAWAQTADGAPKVNHLYVDTFGNKLDANQLKKELVKELHRTKDLELVDSPAAANDVLTGDAEIYVRGYVSLYVRAGSSPRHGNPIYGGYASAELKNSSGEIVWSYLATVHHGSKDAAHDLAKEIVRHLLASFPASNNKK